MSELLPSVHIVDLHFYGQPSTIAAYLLTAPDGTAALIETGPSSTITALLDGIRGAGVDPAAVSEVLVTHIHLDHSGAAGVLLRDAMPQAHVLVHPMGLPHLVDPSRLLRSAARLYGERMDELWGEVAPVPAERAAALDDHARLRLAGHEVEIHFTPGHAAHHAAVRHLATGAIFCGDAAGVRVPGAAIINPPTVPPEFDLVAWQASIERLLSLDPTLLLLGHYGPSPDPRAHLAELRQRLEEWTDAVRTGLAEGRSVEEIGRALQARDAARPDTTAAGVRQLDLVAGYVISAGGIARYLTTSRQ